MPVTKRKQPAAKKKAKAKAKPKVRKAAPKKKPAHKAAPAKKRPAARAAATRRPTSAAMRARLTEPAAFLGFAPYKPKRGEPYMSEGQVEHFRGLLQNWKKALMEEVDRTVHHMQDEAANFPDPNDRASQESEFTMELRTRDRERKLIKKIDESLTDLNIGEYGYCEQCGVEIGIQRLEARPTATLCIDCKQLEEIREKKMRE